MKMRLSLIAMVAAVLAMSSPDVVGADSASPQTVITVEEMHCEGCAKQIVAKLKAVRGVAAVKTNMEAKTATVTPKAKVVLSPRVLWDAVEKTQKKVVKLEGPTGEFTRRPAF